MDNALATNLNGDHGMENEDKYYYAAGIRFEKDKEYTVEDYDALPEGTRVELINGVFYEMYPDPDADPTERYVVYPEFDGYDELLRGMAAPSTRHQRIVSLMCHKIWSYIEQKKGNLKEYYTARINQKIRLIMKPIGSYPYNTLEITDIEFIDIDDKHYGEG